jgi:hypothetical protein
MYTEPVIFVPLNVKVTCVTSSSGSDSKSPRLIVELYLVLPPKLNSEPVPLLEAFNEVSS